MKGCDYMRLNTNCIRDILLTIEDSCDFNHSWMYSKDSCDSNFLINYSHDEIIYHISQMSQSGLITTPHYYDRGISILVSDLTPTGHEFLANIRTDTVWKKIKSKGSASLPILIELAKDCALAYYQKN